MPDPGSLPRYDRGTSPSSALGLFTVALGRPPRFVDDAWVWSGVGTPGPTLSVGGPAFDRCTGRALGGDAPEAVPDCVLAASHPTA
jgi:hypothetical protein